ncbi:DUF397 domain-containing protein [Nocardia donostiensis]|uniref:DUF397 domain-containing protein n=1 Tax=Nocardia donostiensis TaxID=1538463 RepID=A0A1W0BAH4_9NOCA|nr:DUF397 domain-containing protein [Nocardia donostiensis]ONM49053.1 DUF397 domain-containing protein [Nocardia donostiensis]OQS14070.1 DUF397 domain-containing protein [Nocardia donostiensis]OQS19533.1 DUF397 domain-containing protein [Nocardia donostiensis]
MATTAADRRRDVTGWFTSTRSNNGNQCVEVRFDRGVVLIRDSKFRRHLAQRRGAEPVITVTAGEWTAFLRTVTHRGAADGELSACTGADGSTTLRYGGTALVFTAAEWGAFLAGACDGEFDRLDLPS